MIQQKVDCGNGITLQIIDGLPSLEWLCEQLRRELDAAGLPDHCNSLRNRAKGEHCMLDYNFRVLREAWEVFEPCGIELQSVIFVNLMRNTSMGLDVSWKELIAMAKKELNEVM